ncbi:MAG TPA: DUF2207 domain-containing protein [Chloroflexota bacterium]|jgi:hypothetical protein
MQPQWRWLVALAMVAAAWVALGRPVQAQSNDVVADRYDVDVTVADGGALEVVEHLQLDFQGGTFQHGFLNIALGRVEALRDVRVGEPGHDYSPGRESQYTYATTRDGDRLRIDWWFPPTTNDQRTFEISYRAEGALRVYPDGDQVYWQAIGADHGYPIRQSRVLVHLPADLSANQLKLAAYPERQRVASRQIDPRTVAFETSDLAAGTGLVVRVQFPHGLVNAQPPSWQAAADRADFIAQNVRPALDFVCLALALLIAGVGLGSLALLWRTRGRDPDVAPGAPTLSAPPDDLPAPLAGTLLDEQADVQDVLATLVDLANRGVLRMTPVEESGATSDYELERLKADAASLRGYERLLLTTLFGEGSRVRLSQVRGIFAAAIPGLQAGLYQEVARAGLFAENPEVVRQRYRGLGIALGVIGIVGAIAVGSWLAAYADLGWLPFVALAVVGGALVWVAPHMPQRTRSGALAAQRWAAFRRYLAEQARGRGETPSDQFEPYLPYAIAFGIDRAWIARFAAAGTPTPPWYQGGGPVIVGTPGWGGYYPGGWYPGGYGGGGWGGPSGSHPVPGPGDGAAAPGSQGAGGLQGVSDSLSDMLDRASDVFASGGGGGSGGGDGGGWSGGGMGDFGGSSGGGGGGGSGYN